MNGKKVGDYLQEICHAMDAGRPVSKTTLRNILAPVAIPAAMTFALGLPACIQDASTEYAAPFEANCEDDVDNDGDGLTDCADDDCFDEAPCMDLYGAAFEDDCDDLVDNDGDGLVDCDDTEDCSTDPACVGNLYGAPWA